METAPVSPLNTEQMPPGLVAALGRFAPISLGDMSSVSLMRRIDTKYIIHQDQLTAILQAVEDRYAILEIDRQRAMRYASQYFDTAACKFLTITTTAGPADQGPHPQLCRLGDQLPGDQAEERQGRHQQEQDPLRADTTAEMELVAPRPEFIDDTIASTYDLQPTVRNRFRRITLVDTDRSERVTIDWDLSSHLERVEY